MSTLRLRLDRWSASVLARPIPLFICAAALLLVQIGPWWYSAHDSACYLSMGRTFWSGDGPLSLGDKYKAYAVGYSFLLSPLFWISERPFILIGILHFALAGIAAVGIYRWASAFGRNAAIFATAFTLMHGCFGLYFRRPLSEMSYIAALYWTVAILHRIPTSTTDRERRWYAVAGTLMLLLAFQFRHNGVLLAPGFAIALCYDAWRRGTGLVRAVLCSGIMVAIVGAAFMYERSLDDRWAFQGQTHWNYIAKHGAGKFDKLVDGVRIQMLEFLRVTVPGALKSHEKTRSWLTANVILSMIVTIPLAYGWWMLMRRRADVLLCALPFFMMLNVAYSNDQGGRYTLPFLPVIAVILWTLLERCKIEPSRLLMPFLVVHVGVGIAYWVAVDLPRMQTFDERWQDLDIVAAKIDTHRGQVAVRDLTPFERDRLELTLDRHACPMEGDMTSLPVPAYWILTSQTAAVPAGYVCVAQQGPYQVLKTVATEPPPILADGSDKKPQDSARR